MRRFKKGNRVKVIGYRASHWNCSGDMDIYLNRIVKIRIVLSSSSNFDYRICQDDNDNTCDWVWKDSDFIPLEKCIFANDYKNEG